MMNSRVLFGSFVPVDSVLHRLDPRLKLVTCFWYVVIIFFAKGPLTYLLLVAMLGAMIGLSKVPLKMYWADNCYPGPLFIGGPRLLALGLDGDH